MTKDNLIFRAATSEDIESLVELWWASANYHQALESRLQYASNAEDATREFMSTQIESEDSFLCIALNEDTLVGYIEAMMTERPPIFSQRRIGYIGSIFVEKEARRKGVGTKLWQLAYDWLMEKGVPTINLSVAWKNPAALEFWKKQNFSEIMIRLELDSGKRI